MKNQGMKGIVGSAGFAVVALALAGSPAFAAEPAADPTVTGSSTSDMAGPNPSRTQTVHATVVVTAIDKDTRHLTVKKPDGTKQTFEVPSDVKAFDKLKVGDKIDVDYGESIAVSMLPPGSKPSMSERAARAPGAVGREVTVSAEVVSVDPVTNHITLKGPKGNLQTIAVQDPQMQAKLPNVKAGQVLQFTYTEAMIASIQPPASK
jgi:hypothetical protein